LDSRSAEGLACDIRGEVNARSSKADVVIIDATVTNTGRAVWLAAGRSPGGVSLGAHLYDASGALVAFDFHTQPLTDPARDIAPGEAVSVRLTLPSLKPGRYRLELDCVADHVTWFAQAGSKTVTLDVNRT
jgi:hypothetical protein